MLPEDHLRPFLGPLGPFPGLFARIGIVMAGMILLLAAVLVNLKLHAGVEISRLAIEISFGVVLATAVAAGLLWHWRTGFTDD